MGKYVRLADQYKDRLYRARNQEGVVLATIQGEEPVYFEDVPSGVLERLNSGFLVEVPAGDLTRAEKKEAKEESEVAHLRADLVLAQDQPPAEQQPRETMTADHQAALDKLNEEANAKVADLQKKLEAAEKKL